MSTGLVWSNLLAYSLQIGLVVGLGALGPLVLRLSVPRVRLLYWQVLLVACLALPFVRTWRQEVVVNTIQMSTIVTTVAAGPAVASHTIPFTTIALWLLAAGVAIRLGCLAVGLFRLGAYRRLGQEIPPELRMPGASAQAALLLSDDVAGPVTFGWREPVILLPAHFPSLEVEMREAIICHELQHVERQDWLFTIGEELLRAVFWFHPAIWWVIGEIQLAREQTVDQSVIEMTQAREPYVDALLLMAGASIPDGALAAAPMFLRRRHLKKRLLEVVKEAHMRTISNARFACLMSAGVALVAVAGWVATGAFPLSAAPQVVNDGNGVAVNSLAAPLMHRSPVPYPVDALAKGIEGTVVVQMKVDSNGEVSDAAVLSGPDELRKGVLQSVLTWHFERSAALSTQTVNINFTKPAGLVVSTPAVSQGAVRPANSLASAQAAFRPVPSSQPTAVAAAKIDRITVTGLSDQARDELLSKLPVHAGDEWSPQALTAATVAARAFDPHLAAILSRTPEGGFEIRLSLTNALPSLTFTGGTGMGGGIATSAAAPLPPGIFSVGNGTSPPAVLTRVDPDYTEQARAAKYSGSVMLSIVVNAEGQAEDLRVVKSLGMGLDEEAIKAVEKWVFRPGMNRGVPVKVRAQIEVNFRLL